MTNTVLNELIAKEVTEKIYEKNIFLSELKNVTEYLSNGVVTLPNFVGNDNDSVTVNGSGFLHEYIETAEQPVTFNVDILRLKPTLVTNFEEMITNYNKFELVLRDKINNLTDVASKKILQKLASQVDSTRILSTTGTTGTANGAGGGNKKKIQFTDLVQLQAKFNADSIADENRWLIVDHVMYSELVADDKIIKYMEFGKPIAESGKCDMVMGFNIIIKPSIATTDGTSGLVQNYGASIDASDSRVALAFSSDVPVLAMSEVKVYTRTDDVMTYGSLVSAEIALGCTSPRYDKKGVYLIKQG